MHSVKKIFFIPVGLPGMGKSTLAKHIRTAVEKNFAGFGLQNGTLLNSAKTHHLSENYLSKAQAKVDFHKISYDRILGDNLNAYQKLHPETPFHVIIDIIRDKAD